MQDVDKFNYLGEMISTDGGMGEDVAHRVLEGRKVWEMMKNLWKENMISSEVKRELYERVVIPNVVQEFGDVVIKCTGEEKNRSI